MATEMLDAETRAGNTRHVLELIDRFGFNAVAASAVFDELDRRAQARHVSADFGLRFDVSDRATLADVWSRGMRARRGDASSSG